jgi:type-F conjugative transfer system pilin assembly protein TrbC
MRSIDQKDRERWGLEGVASVKVLLIIIMVFVMYMDTYGGEREGVIEGVREEVRIGKDILREINEKSQWNMISESNVNSCGDKVPIDSNFDIKIYQKGLDKETVEWTKNLERRMSEDIKSQEQMVMPSIKATEEDMRVAQEIIEGSKVIIDESLGIFKDQGVLGESHTDFLMFASFSIGEKGLKNLIKQAAVYRGAVILRGFKNGDLKETAKFLLQFAGKGGEGIAIDPTLFEEYSITKVPTYVLTRPCEEVGLGGRGCKIQYDKLVGNVSPRYALEKFSERGELSKEALERLGR